MDCQRLKDVVDREEKFEELSQYIYSFAKEFGCENSLTYDNQFECYMPTLEFVKEMEEYIDASDEDVFWLQLVSRLSKRDAMKESKLHKDREALIRRSL